MKKFTLSFIVIVLLFTALGSEATAQPNVKRVVYRDGGRYYAPRPARRHYVTRRYYAAPPRGNAWRGGHTYRSGNRYYGTNPGYYRHDNGRHKGWYKKGHYYRRR